MKSTGVRVKLDTLNAVKEGAHRFSLRDPYHLVLTISWPAFFLLAVLFYLLTNLCFALAYTAVPACIANVAPGDFVNLFFFSIETLATVGYGVMSPNSLYGHIVASTEIIFGMMSMAVITGLIFTRFSRPRSRIVFSRVAVIAPYETGTALMLRITNERHQAIAEASARLTMIRPMLTAEGKAIRRFLDLKLERNSTPLVGLSWTLIHPIDEASPLWKLGADELSRDDMVLIASVTGYDESISAAVVARQNYPAGSILVGHEFVDIMRRLSTGEIALDMKQFHDVEACEIPR